jgi:hypothetical protein
MTVQCSNTYGKIVGDFSERSPEPVWNFTLKLMGTSFSIYEFSRYEHFSSNELRS